MVRQKTAKMAEPATSQENLPPATPSEYHVQPAITAEPSTSIPKNGGSNCRFPSCQRIFLTPSARSKHEKNVHTFIGKAFFCPKCPKHIRRRDHLLTHFRNIHKMNKEEARLLANSLAMTDIPVEETFPELDRSQTPPHSKFLFIAYTSICMCT